MSKVVGRWCAGRGHWHEDGCFEIVLEHAADKWLVTYLAHGEPHARIGFDTEEEAHGDIRWLMSILPADVAPWERLAEEGI
ncbi:hypothetical protein [Saccharopolyspora sp. NPDC002376]